jgi:UDP-N-acetylglucosamine 2-epimerase (non-hydrolysing)
VLTDSGGIQEETTVLCVPCPVLLNNTERPATVERATNALVRLDPERIVSAGPWALEGPLDLGRLPEPWDGGAASCIVDVLMAGADDS